MSVIPSQVPQRLPAGSTSDPPYGPWADNGNSNPFFYHQFADDFDNALGAGASTLYTTTSVGGGTVVHTAGDGGLALFTTGATATNFEEIQLPAASFTVPQGTLAGKKLFYLTRLQLSDVTNAGLVAGLVNTNTTPFTGGITDGIWFSKASASTQLVINIAASSTTKSFNVATNTYSLANNVNIDLAFYVDKYGNVQYSVGSQLVGWIPQSGTSAVSSSGVPLLPVNCPTGKLYSGNQPTTVGSGYTLPTANLNITLAVLAGTASAKTMTVDFHGAAKER